MPAVVDGSIVEQRIVEAAMRLPAGGAVTGWAALRLFGGGFFDGIARDGATALDVPLALPPGTGLRPGDGYVVRRERLPVEDVTTRYGVPCTTPARAVFDEMRRVGGTREAVMVLDLALAAGLITQPGLEALVGVKAGWPGSSVVRAALPLADSRSASPQETRMRLIWMLDAGLPRPVCNVDVGDADGNFIGRPDLLSRELSVVGEFDGAMHRTRSRHRVDVRREDGFRRVGLEVFTLVGADLRDIPLVVGRMKAAAERARRSPVARLWTTRR